MSSRSLAEPPPRLCAPRGSAHPPTSICSAALMHAARDGTQVFLSLLPVDIRAEVDRLHRTVAWHHVGELISVPNMVVDARGLPNVARLISAEGNEVVVISERPPGGDLTLGEQVNIVRIDLPLDHPHRVRTVPGRLNSSRGDSIVDEPGQPPLLITTVLGPRKSMFERVDDVQAILSDLNGTVIKKWVAAPGTCVLVLSGGWVATNCRQGFATSDTELFYVYTPDVPYKLPPEALPDGLFSLVEPLYNFGTPKVFVKSRFSNKGPIRQRLSLWDLKTGAAHYSLEYPKATVKIFPGLGLSTITQIVAVGNGTSLGDTELRCLMTGAHLCLDTSRGSDEEVSDDVVFLGTNDAVHKFWHRDQPTAITAINLSDWSARCVNGVIVAYRDEAFAVCQTSTGRVVRTDIPPKVTIPWSGGVLHTEDAVFVQCETRNVLYVTPLTHIPVSSVTSVSLRDAADLPLVHARALSIPPCGIKALLMPRRAPYGLGPMFLTNDGQLLRIRQ